jgi:hypothetical protein
MGVRRRTPRSGRPTPTPTLPLPGEGDLLCGAGSACSIQTRRRIAVVRQHAVAARRGQQRGFAITFDPSERRHADPVCPGDLAVAEGAVEHDPLGDCVRALYTIEHVVHRTRPMLIRIVTDGLQLGKAFQHQTDAATSFLTMRARSTKVSWSVLARTNCQSCATGSSAAEAFNDTAAAAIASNICRFMMFSFMLNSTRSRRRCESWRRADKWSRRRRETARRVPPLRAFPVA